MQHAGVTERLRSPHADQKAYSTAITKLTKGSDWRGAMSVLAELASAKSVPNVFTCTAAINACGKSGHWQHALKLFLEFKARSGQANVITYGSVINACANGEEWHRSLLLLQDLQDEGLEINVILFSSAISACERAGEWRHALSLLSELRDTATESNVILYNATLSSFKHTGEWEHALHLLAVLDLSTTRADVVTYGSAVATCELRGSWREAQAVLESSDHIPPDKMTCNAILRACVHGQDWGRALQCVRDLERNMTAQTVDYSMAISVCEKCEQWEQALLLLQEILGLGLRSRDEAAVASISACISACARSGQWEWAIRLLEEAKSVQMADIITWNSAISACEKGGEMWQAHRLLHEATEKDLQVNAITYNAAITSCWDRWQEAEVLMSEMQDLSILPNTITYNAVIAAHEKGGQWQRAQLWLQTMKVARLQTDIISYNSVISSCVGPGLWQEALRLLRELEQRELQASIVTYSAAIAVCEKSGNWQMAVALLEGLQHRRVQANVIAYNAALASCRSSGSGGQWQQAESLWQEIRTHGVLADIITFNAAISTFEKGGEWEHCLRWLCLLQPSWEGRSNADVISYSSSISACAKHGMWQQAQQLLRDVHEQQMQGNTITFSVLVTAVGEDGQWQQTVLLLRELEGQGLEATSNIFASAIVTFDQHGRWHEAIRGFTLASRCSYRELAFVSGNKRIVAQPFSFACCCLEAIDGVHLSMSPNGACAFKRFVAPQVGFAARCSRDDVFFHLEDGCLQLCVNRCFAKTVSILRFHQDGAEVLDQDGWAAKVPPALFPSLATKLRRLAAAAQVPVFVLQGAAAIKTVPASVLRLPAGSGEFAVGLERCSLWPPGSGLFLGQAFAKFAPEALGLLAAAASWAVGRAAVSVAVLEACLEGHALATALPHAAAAPAPAPAVAVVLPGTGAREGLSLALVLASLLARGFMDVALIQVEGGSIQDPFLQSWVDRLPETDQAPQGLRVWAFPLDAAGSASACLEEALEAYQRSRPYIHALVGAGVMEADIREALETSVHALESAQVLELTDAQGGLLAEPLQCSRRTMWLLPIGRRSRAVAALVEARLEDTWALTSVVREAGHGQTLALLDLADPDSLCFLKARQKDPFPLHVLALLPSLDSTRVAWRPVAEPLALLLGLGEDFLLELGLVAALGIGDETGLETTDVLSFLEALASADMSAVAFQLQPRPQTHLALPAFEADSTAILCAESAALGEKEVLASFTLWPSTGESRLLAEGVLQDELPASVSRAGMAYRPSAQSTAQPRVWHLTVHVMAEARLCRRAAGDFGGRASGAFAWRGDPGSKADLWAHAALLLGEEENPRREEEESSCYSEEYEQEDGAESEENVSTDSQSEAASATLSSQSSRQKSFVVEPCLNGICGYLWFRHVLRPQCSKPLSASCALPAMVRRLVAVALALLALPASLALEDEDEVLRCVLFVARGFVLKISKCSWPTLQHKHQHTAASPLLCHVCHGPWPMAASRTVVTGWACSLSELEELQHGALKPDNRKLGKTVAHVAGVKRWVAVSALLGDAWAGNAQIDVVTLGAAASACRVAAGWRWGFELLASGRGRTICSSAVLRGTVLGVVRAGGVWAAALTLLAESQDHGCRVSAVHLSTVAATASEGNLWGVASAILQAESGVALDPPAISSQVASLSKGSQWQGSFDVFVRQTPFLTVRLANAALTAMEVGELWPSAIALLGDLQQARLRQDIRGVNSAASAAAKGVGWRWSLDLLERSRHDAEGRDLVGVNVALAAHARGFWGASLSLLRALPSFGHAPDVTSFGTVANACKRAGRLALAKKLLDEAQRSEGFTVSATIFGAVVAGCTWVTASALLESARAAAVEADTALANAAASACEQHGAWQTATRLLPFLGQAVDCLTIGAATAACAVAGAWVTALALLLYGSWRALSSGPVARAAAAAAARQAGRWRQVVALLTWCGIDEDLRLDIPGAMLAASCLEVQRPGAALQRLYEEVSSSASLLLSQRREL
eukprot:s4371_g11.t2